MTDLRENIQAALADFQSLPLPDAARRLFGVLGYESERTIPLRGVKGFLTTFDPQSRLTPKEKETLSNLSSLHLLFQLSDAELTTISCLEFIRHKLPFRSIVVHEDFDALPRKDRSRLTSACDKQFTSLDDFRSGARQFLEREKVH